MRRRRASLLVSLAACAPSVLEAPADPLLALRLRLMSDFEQWFQGFRDRLRDPAPETARDCAAEAVFVLRNDQLWSTREMAPSVVERERLLQISRWEAARAAAGLPRDLRAAATLAALDDLAGDRQGAAAARCDAARLSDGFDAQVGCARSLALAGRGAEAIAAWHQAFAVAGDDARRFWVLGELTREGHADAVGSFPGDVVFRWRSRADWERLGPGATPSTGRGEAR